MAFHIIGDADTVLGYRFAGVNGDVVETTEEARAAFKAAIANRSKGVLLITEAVEDMLTEEVTAHRLSSKPPYLAVMQDIWGPRGKRRSLQDLIYEAVGIRIVQDD
ncbi:MAG: ATP synthase subunit F [Lentisphaerae bacterium]|jgi:V/A-type H+-transporting ATPase subunit F|nr:ATP synthase subunit F [Lentisphaerota bacterium]